MGGTVDLFLRCFAGMAVREDRICLNPDLPETWQRIHFHVRYKNIWFEVTIKRKTITVKAELLPQMTFGAGDIPIEICKKRYILKPGEPVTMALPGKD
jgi:trehalose/maltose hydrolase-like predicted phosphorylase